jgi:RimJ/RimL family protein N-acetyltransferase
LTKTDVERYRLRLVIGWGKNSQGICTLVLKATTPYAIETYQLNRIFAVPFTRNIASIRVLEKAGYTREGIMKRSAFKDGRFVDEALYAFVIEDWTPNEAK